jgi:hypothetical protein
MSDEGVVAVKDALRDMVDTPATHDAGVLLLHEIRAYPIYVERLLNPKEPVAWGRQRRETRPPSELAQGVSIGGTILDSVRDLLELSKEWKAFLKMVSEAIDAWKELKGT